MHYLCHSFVILHVKRVVLLLLMSPSSLAFAQEPRAAFGVEGQYTFETDKPFKLLELDEVTSEPIVTKKKKPRRKTYYGIKTKKGFTRKGFGDRVVIETFYYLKRPDKATPFVRDIYWYDFTRREIRRAGFDPKKGVLVHGPYKKMQGDVLLEEGIFYKGTKHGRWMKYDRQGLLDDKEKYYKGWPKESLVTYYDPVERTKVKEMIPIEFSEREGYYVMYHENGTVAVQGEFMFDQKVGEWIENYPSGKRKKTIAYPADPFDKTQRPFVRKEWDVKGKEIYWNSK